MRSEANRLADPLIDALASGAVSIGRIVWQVVILASLFLAVGFIDISFEGQVTSLEYCKNSDGRLRNKIGRILGVAFLDLL